MQYRAYFIDEQDHVRGAADVEAATPLEAARAAENLRGLHMAVELWRLDRFICRFEPVAEWRSFAAEAAAPV